MFALYYPAWRCHELGSSASYLCMLVIAHGRLSAAHDHGFPDEYLSSGRRMRRQRLDTLQYRSHEMGKLPKSHATPKADFTRRPTTLCSSHAGLLFPALHQSALRTHTTTQSTPTCRPTATSPPAAPPSPTLSAALAPAPAPAPAHAETSTGTTP